jgi:hypothetical protein
MKKEVFFSLITNAVVRMQLTFENSLFQNFIVLSVSFFSSINIYNFKINYKMQYIDS